MQTRIHSELDCDLGEKYQAVTETMTELNRYRLICGDCNKTCFADSETYRRFCDAIEKGLDNPFLCTDCQEENDAAAFAGLC